MIVEFIADIIKKEYEKEPPVSTFTRATEQELETLYKECGQFSSFDPLEFRKHILTTVPTYICKKSAHGNIIALLPSTSYYPPFDLWFRILRTFYNDRPYTIFYLAHQSQRELPDTPPIGPQNINGGYTYPCDPNCIVIYREQDATRVLIHELLHASCTDRFGHSGENIDRNEAETEAWAELIACGFYARGSLEKFRKAIRLQSAWMQSQNRTIEPYFKNQEFPWRYTVGKQEVWSRWGILQTDYKRLDTKRSLALLYPKFDNAFWNYSD